MNFDKLLESIHEELRQLNGRELTPAEERAARSATYEHLKRERRPSRFADENADPDVLDAIAGGGGVRRGRVVEPEDAVERRRSGRRQGLGVAATMTKALAEGTGAAGGFLVDPEVSDEIVKLIRARSAVRRLGPRTVPVKKELSVTSLSTGASASWVAENAAIPISEQTFAQAVLLRPKELAALVPVSNRLLRDAAENPDVEDVIRSDLAEVLALREDLTFLRGTGTGNEPTGVRNTSGLTPAPSLGANGAAPTFDHLKDMVANLRVANAPFSRPGWAFHPRTLNALEKLKDGQGRYLAEAGLLTFDATGGGGTLLNFPFVTTTQIPVNLTAGTNNDTSEIYFSSDWQEFWIGENLELEIAVSGETTYDQGGGVFVSAFQARQHVFRAVRAEDCALRRPQLFSVMTGVRPGP